MHLKRKILISSIITLSCLLFFILLQVKTLSSISPSEDTLQKSFNKSGAKVVKSEIYLWDRLGSGKDVKSLFSSFTDEIISKLNVTKDRDFKKTTFENDSIYKVDAEGVTSGGRIITICCSMQKGADERQLNIKITQDLSNEGLVETRQKAAKVFNDFGMNPKVNTCITGTFEGNMNYSDLNRVLGSVFKTADARKVEGIEDGKLLSVSAYSPVIDGFIKVNDKKINMNAAIRYNSFENKTYIWLATPVITTEY